MNRNFIILMVILNIACLGSTQLWSQDNWGHSFSTDFPAFPPQGIDLHERILVEWDTPEIHPLGEVITIKGRVYFNDRPSTHGFKKSSHEPPIQSNR